VAAEDLLAHKQVPIRRPSGRGLSRSAEYKIIDRGSIQEEVSIPSPHFTREQVLFVAKILNEFGGRLTDESATMGMGLVSQLVQLGACEASVLEQLTAHGDVEKEKRDDMMIRHRNVAFRSIGSDLVVKRHSMDETALYGREMRKASQKELSVSPPSASPPTYTRSTTSNPPDVTPLVLNRQHKRRSGLALLFGRCAIVDSPRLNERRRASFSNQKDQ